MKDDKQYFLSGKSQIKHHHLCVENINNRFLRFTRCRTKSLLKSGVKYVKLK